MQRVLVTFAARPANIDFIKTGFRTKYFREHKSSINRYRRYAFAVLHYRRNTYKKNNCLFSEREFLPPSALRGLEW